MINGSLQSIFFAAESVAFQDWRVASKKRKEEICRKLGKWEAEITIKEINKEAKEYARRNPKITESHCDYSAND